MTGGRVVELCVILLATNSREDNIKISMHILIRSRRDERKKGLKRILEEENASHPGFIARRKILVAKERLKIDVLCNCIPKVIMSGQLPNPSEMLLTSQNSGQAQG